MKNIESSRKIKRGIVKIGGARGNDLMPLVTDLSSRIKNGEKWLLVHGASGYMEDLMEICGLEPKYVTSPGGYRSRFTGITEKKLFFYACNALSVKLTGLFYSSSINTELLYPSMEPTGKAKRKDALKIVENGRTRMLRGNYSGKVISFESDAVEKLWDMGKLPVLPPLALDIDSGDELNVDGDRLAAAAASSCSADVLVILSNVPGLMKDPEVRNSLVRSANLKEWENLEKYAKGNMKRKLLAAKEAIQGGVPEVRISDSRIENPLTYALNGGGTALCQ